MKKIYKSLFAMGLIATAVTVSAQTDAQMSPVNFTDAEVSSILEGVQVATFKANTGEKATCTNNLTTPVAGGNSYDGNMFDITATNTVTIETFAVTVDDPGTPVTIEIYARTGSFVGYESTSTGWTLVGSGSITGAGVGNPVEVPTDIAYTMNAGTTHAFYVTLNATGVTSFNYTNGTAVGNTWASDANITLKEGNGGAYPFSVTFSPRNFNGTVIYCIPTGVEETLSTNTISVYPNPANTVLNIDVTALNGQTSSVAIYNVLGAQVLAHQNISNTTINTLDISNLETGIYFVKVVSGGEELTTKLIVE